MGLEPRGEVVLAHGAAWGPQRSDGEAVAPGALATRECGWPPQLAPRVHGDGVCASVLAEVGLLLLRFSFPGSLAIKMCLEKECQLFIS